MVNTDKVSHFIIYQVSKTKIDSWPFIFVPGIVTNMTWPTVGQLRDFCLCEVVVNIWIESLHSALRPSEYDFYSLSSNPAADDRDYSRPLSMCDGEQSTLLFRQVDLLVPAWQDCLLIERPSDYSSIGGETQVFIETVGMVEMLKNQDWTKMEVIEF